jgi:hypothetical protein
MSDQLNSLKQLVKHAVKPIKVLTDTKLVQEPIRIDTKLEVIPADNIIDTPSPYPQPSFININKGPTPVAASRQEIKPTPVEASRQIDKPIPRPRVNTRRTETPVEISVDTDISFAIRVPTPQIDSNMEDERIYLGDVIATLELTEVDQQTPNRHTI